MSVLLRRVGHQRPWPVYRSTAMRHLGESQAHAVLSELEVQTWVDLRTQPERNRDPVWVRSTHVEIIQCPIRSSPAPASPQPTAEEYADYYLGIGLNPDPLVSGLETVVSCASRGVVVSCAQGKDRTGLLCAALLEAVGASREEILSDFSRGLEVLSNGAIAEERSWVSRGLTRGEYLQRYTLGSAPLEALYKLVGRAGTVLDWLGQDDLLHRRIATLVDKLSESA